MSAKTPKKAKPGTVERSAGANAMWGSRFAAGPEAVMDALHDRMEAEKIACRGCHEKSARPPPGDGWD